jgi:hypothetical protein
MTKIDQSKYPKEEYGNHSMKKEEFKDIDYYPQNDASESFYKMISDEPYYLSIKIVGAIYSSC